MRDPLRDLTSVTRAFLRLPAEAQALVTMINAGLLRPERADRLFAMYRALDRYGAMGASLSVAAVRHGRRIAVIDELGAVTYAEMDRRSNALATALRGRGIGSGSGVGILCRNHRGVYEATYGVLKAGGRALFLNTDFSAPQAEEVCVREGVQALVYDAEFAGVIAGVAAPKGRFVAWSDGPADGSGGDATIEQLMAEASGRAPAAPERAGEVVVLTSGTTGIPKGANRGQPQSLTAAAGILSRIPLRTGDVIHVAPPVYHAWGLGMSVIGFALGATLVIHRRFDPEATLQALESHRCTAVAVVPVMLSRLLALGEDRIRRADLAALRVVASSGAQLDAALATRTMDLLGEILYNLYGSTEVAWATIATPRDLRAAPGCAGRPPPGTRVQILDDDGDAVEPGVRGRIFVRSGMAFAGYTGGGSKQVVNGLMATGDLGHFDLAGRLYVDGREDEMIISGGENVFPREVEELLAAHDAVQEAAAIGVDDDDFGQRLRVFVVVREGHSMDAAGVKDHVRANLARYHVPRDVVFVDQLPRNPSGKVLKRVLAAFDTAP
jgi:fatty-acyl-CoA synthase